MKEPIYKVSRIVIGSKCAVMRSTSQLVANVKIQFKLPVRLGYIAVEMHKQLPLVTTN